MAEVVEKLPNAELMWCPDGGHYSIVAGRVEEVLEPMVQESGTQGSFYYTQAGVGVEFGVERVAGCVAGE